MFVEQGQSTPRVPTNPVSKNVRGDLLHQLRLSEKRLGHRVESTLPLSTRSSLRPPGKELLEENHHFFGHMEVEVAGVEPASEAS